jgi:MgtC family
MNSVEWDILVRAIVAAALGYIVGAEREYIAHREAGTRTFSLVSLGSALVTAAALLLSDPPALRALLRTSWLAWGSWAEKWIRRALHLSPCPRPFLDQDCTGTGPCPGRAERTREHRNTPRR